MSDPLVAGVAGTNVPVGNSSSSIAPPPVQIVNKLADTGLAAFKEHEATERDQHNISREAAPMSSVVMIGMIVAAVMIMVIVLIVYVGGRKFEQPSAYQSVFS